VSRCVDGDVVGIGEGGGGGFRERRKTGRKVGGRGRHAFVEYMAQREHHCTWDVWTGTRPAWIGYIFEWSSDDQKDRTHLRLVGFLFSDASPPSRAGPAYNNADELISVYLGAAGFHWA